MEDVLAGSPVTEDGLRRLVEWAEARVQALDARIQAGESRVDVLAADASSSLTAIARELRGLQRLRPGRTEARAQLDALETRARQLRTRRLIEQATGLD